jgi:hypothetical protein
MEMAVKSMETAVEAMASMEMALGALPHPCPLKFVGGGDRAAELVLEKHRLI